MKCKFAKTNSPAAALRRAASVGALALTALLAAPPHAGAQSPVVSSPGVPTVSSWPNFHAGGPQVPQVNSNDTALTGQDYTLPDTYSFANPLSWQLNGTPTGIVGGVATEIPSFSIGNFNPLQGPSGPVGTFFPNHFRDGSFYQIAGPFPFIFPNLLTTPEVVDDQAPTAGYPTPNAFAVTGTWATVGTGDTTGTAATATNQEYLTQSLAPQDVTSTTVNPLPTAQWAISPGAASLPAGFYSVMVHLPNSPDATTNSTATTPLIFSQDAHYTVRLNSATSVPVADVRIAQGIVNDQTLAGPFLLQPTDVLYVTLDNSTNLVQSSSTVVVADSISLQQNTGGDVESAPAAINVTEYPEIANAEYFGLAAGTNSLAPPTTAAPAADTLPRGNTTINQTPFDPTQNVSSDPTGQPANHAIRQLVYFGRLETVPETITDSSGTHAVRAHGTTLATDPVLTQQVGAIYCMDGFTGGIVWRYQTPGTYNNLGQVTAGAGPVFSSPAVARVNVRVDPSSTSTLPYATKLVVVIADNRGFVYCLDAVGDRDGTSNSNAVYQDTDNTQPNYIAVASGLVGLPILNPGIDPTGKPVYTAHPTGSAAIGDFGTTTTDPPHEGNTTAYWVYRPDPIRPKVVFGGTPGTIKTTLDPASDLPVPGAFGLASPTVYTAGYVPTATGTTGATDYPGATGVATLNSNSIVYIGNGNGVLYALDGLGYPVQQPTAGAAYLDSGTTGDPFNASLDIEDKLATATATTTFLPTPRPLWWFSIRGAVNDPNNTSSATIESAPAVFVSPNSATTGGTNQNVDVTVYVTSAHESTSVASSGRLYAVNGLLGPSGNGGRSIPTAGPLVSGVIQTAATSVAGTLNYNVNQRPQLSKTDTQHWSFPDAYGADQYVTGQSSNGKARPALGNITGSPVVFANTKEPITAANGQTYPAVNIYIAANSGPEVEYDLTTGNQTAAVPDDNTTGRVWKVGLTGKTVWAYPQANDPNDATLQNTHEPSPPMGAFLYATPAMGYVQFPAQIIDADGSLYTHSDQSNANIANNTGQTVGISVPMLYIATSGYDDALAGPGFYSLDIDTDIPHGGGTYPTAGNTGDQDSTREIEAIPSPSGETFVSSPALVVNPSLTAAGATAMAGPGNGGAVFVVGSAGTLVQFGATPITNNFGTANLGAAGDTSNQPYFPVDKQITGLGPISAPAVASANVFDLSTAAAVTSTFFTSNNVQNWVYLGSSDGLCFGITPAGFNGGGFDPGTVGPPTGPGTGPVLGSVSNQFILHTYITTDQTKKDFAAADKPDPASTTQPLPTYEWGENVNIRVTNVVPPKTAGQDENTSYKVYDDQTGDYYDNGQPITFSVTAISPTTGSGKTTPRTIPATVVTPLPGTLPGDGFVVGSDANIPYNNTTAGNANGKLTTLTTGAPTPATDLPATVAENGAHVWVAATTYPVRDEEPGAQHRLISVTQIADHYKFTPGSGTTAGTYAYVGSVTLQATLSQGTQFANASGTALQYIPAVPQPVFAVLNPLAVRGAGIPIAFSNTTPNKAVPFGNFNGQPAGTATDSGTDGLGPFRGLVSTGGASPMRPLTNLYDLQALTNGNRVYTLHAPPSSVSGTITGPAGGRRRNRQTQYPERNVRVTTSTGLVNHNSTGSNADPNAITSVTLVGNVAQSTNNGLTPTASPNAPYGQFMLDVTDRSALGLAGSSIAKLRMDRNPLGWNDNTGLFGNASGTTPANPTNGAGASINPLPWDDTPVTGSNHSRDYPDIKASASADILNNTDITAASGTLDPAQVNGSLDSRNVLVDPVKVQVSVPRFQPANLQFYDQANGPITPDNVTPANSTFPMGYVNTVRVYVDSGGANGQSVGHWVQGDAYRNIQVFSGVPVDMTTSIDTPTTDLGKLPQGFGLQTDAFTPLGTFMPYPTGAQVNLNAQNPGYVQFFKPLTVTNRGNTNLLNVHLDQKIDTDTQRQTRGLPLVGDTLESTAQLFSYDSSGSGSAAVTGPPGTLPGTAITEGDGVRSFLLRSSLDDDLVAAYGRNPGLVTGGTPYNALGATFHKSRVGDSNPALLTVPDVPRDNDPTNAGSGYNLAVISRPPVVTQTGLRTTAPNGPRAASIPYVALAIPQGTPVGTYATRLQLFEGVDPSGYKNIYNGGTNNNGPYVPILPPQYGTQTINTATNGSPTFAKYSNTAVATDFYGDLIDTLIAPNNVPSLPYSNGTVIKATVTEARLTDNASRGDLPQVDVVANPATPTVVTAPDGTMHLPAADFLPSAFRDPNTGSVSLYWTSSRNATAAAPYNVFGANLGFNTSYFTHPNASSTWWQAVGLPTPTTGLFSAISVVPTGSYAFVQNVSGGGTNGPVQNRLLCYQVTPGTGALTGIPVPVTANTSQPAIGARGLVTTSTYADAYPGSTSTQPITNNLWAFWYGGSRNRSAIYYNSATANGGVPGTFGAPAVLPIPAGLVSVSDPVAVESAAPDPNDQTKSYPVLEVTYTGTAADGNADIYVSRYRPYYVRNAQGTATTQVALALLASPSITEQLQATDGNLYYQARDVAWTRPSTTNNAALNIVLNNNNLLLAGGTVAQGFNNTPYKTTYDRATGQVVYTNVNSYGATTGPLTVYVDLARGRIRFSPQPVSTATPSVFATFEPQARRITTDTRADTAPVSFLDEAPKPNEANSAGANLGTVTANRYWFIWRKSGAPGTSTTPTLYYKTQRLTVDLQLRDANGQPIGIKLMNTGSATAPAYVPNVTVTANGMTLFSPTSTTNLADVDWVRGRIYLPLTDGTNPLEGALVTAKGTRNDATGSTFTVTDNAHWLDEPRFNANSSSTVAPLPTGSPITTTALTAAATGDAAIPIDTVANESNVTAFLDPSASATNPHRVWLFWNSTRNGTADIYYETISPLFSATVSP